MTKKSNLGRNILFSFIVMILILAGLALPATGYFLNTLVSAEFKKMEEEFKGNKFRIILVSNKVGFLHSDYRVDVIIPDEKKYTFVLVADNYPNLEQLLKQKLMFSVGGGPVEKEIKAAAAFIPQLGPEKPELIFENIRMEGWFHWPLVVETKVIIGTIKENSGVATIHDLSFELTSHAKGWKQGFGIKKISSKMLELNELEFSGAVTKSDTLKYEGLFKFDAIPESKKLANDIKFRSTFYLDNLPKEFVNMKIPDTLEAPVLMGLDLKLETGKSWAKTTMSGEIKQDRSNVFSFNGSGEFRLFISPDDKELESFKMLMGLKDSKKDHFKKFYNVDVEANPIIIPFQFNDKLFSINGIQYFNCPEFLKYKNQISLEDFKHIPSEQFKKEAMEDLLSEDDVMNLKDSYCRVRYFTEISHPENLEMKFLSNLFNYKINHEMFAYDPRMKEEVKKKLSETGKGLEKQEELYILVSAFNCFVDSKSESCLKNDHLLAYEGVHPFKTLIDSFFKNEADLAQVSQIQAPVDAPEYIKILYAFFKFKSLNRYYMTNNMPKEMLSNTKSHENTFSPKMIQSEEVAYTCRFEKPQKCIDTFEGIKTGISNVQVKNLYLDHKIPVVYKYLPTMVDLNCRGVMEELFTFTSPVKGENIWQKPEWWKKNQKVNDLKMACEKLAQEKSTTSGRSR